MSIIYPKVLDGLGASLVFSNGIPYVIFGYTVYENVNYDTGHYDSANSFRTYTALSEFTYTYIVDKNNADKYIQVTVECGAYTFIFNDGEYQNQGYPLNLYDVVNSINITLGF